MAEEINSNISNDDPKTIRWGLWGTFLWSLFLSFLFVLVQGIASIIYSLVFYDRFYVDGGKIADSFQYHGDILSICTFTTFIFCSAAILAIIKFKKGARIKEYLRFKCLSVRSVVFSFLIITTLIVLIDYLTVSIGRPLVPPYMIESYTSASYKGFLVFSIVFGAPILEELFFRGFLFEGIRGSKLGPFGAVLITSAYWTIIHTQYDLYDLTYLFIIGVVLGCVKLKTKSLKLTIVLHAYLNIIATLQTIYLIS